MTVSAAWAAVDIASKRQEVVVSLIIIVSERCRETAGIVDVDNDSEFRVFEYGVQSLVVSIVYGMSLQKI